MSTQRVLFDLPGPRAKRRHLVLTVVFGLALLAGLWLLGKNLWDRDQITPEKWAPIFTGEAWELYLLPGIRRTAIAAGISIVTSVVLGLVLALARLSDIAPLRWLATVFIEVFRAVPVLIMMLFMWLLLGQLDTLFGIIPIAEWESNSRSLLAVVIGLTCYNSAVIAEVVRSGVGSLPAGQREAGLSIGLTGPQTRRSILLPQALTAMLPSVVSQLVVVLKDTALGYIILYPELLNSIRQLGSRFGNTLVVFVVGALLFIVVNYLLTKLAEYLESRLRRRGRSTATPLVPGTADTPGQGAAIGVGGVIGGVDATDPDQR